MTSLAVDVESGFIRNIAATTMTTIRATTPPPPRIHGNGFLLRGGGPDGYPNAGAGICIVLPLDGAPQCG